jgi:hypothetical protein
MTEGNFVDYVKIFVSSGKGGKAQPIYIEKNLLKKAVQMVVMVVVEDTYI